MEFRTDDNGVRYYPKENGVPPDVPGFTRDATNPYAFHPDFEDCIHRRTIGRLRQCGKVRTVFVCELLGRDVTAEICAFCDKIESNSDAN